MRIYVDPRGQVRGTRTVAWHTEDADDVLDDRIRCMMTGWHELMTMYVPSTQYTKGGGHDLTRSG